MCTTRYCSVHLCSQTTWLVMLSSSALTGSSQGAFKIMPKSPINIRSPQKFAVGSTIRTADGKTIIIGSPQKQQQQQIIIRPSTGGIQQQLQTKENITQQIIRIPASKSETGLQQISAGSKVQYVRVISTQAVSLVSEVKYIFILEELTLFIYALRPRPS
jgi:hypothetical protein